MLQRLLILSIIMRRTYSRRASGFGWGLADHLANISPDIGRVKPHHSIAATLSALSGNSNGEMG